MVNNEPVIWSSHDEMVQAYVATFVLAFDVHFPCTFTVLQMPSHTKNTRVVCTDNSVL
jgi:hypothetical protein